jgi:hypothetical protein
MSWYRSDERDGVAIDAGWDSAGDGMWILIDPPSEGNGQALTLVHASRPKSFATPAIPIGDSIRIEVEGEVAPRLLALTPDDSLVAIGPLPGDRAEGDLTAIVDTHTGTSTLHAGRFAGFVPVGLLGLED